MAYLSSGRRGERTLRTAIFPFAMRATSAVRAAAFHPAMRAGVAVRAAAFHPAMRAASAVRAAAFDLAMRAGVAVRAVVFQLAMRATSAVRAVIFPLAMRAGVAVRAAAFHPAMRAGVAVRTVVLQLAVDTPFPSCHRMQKHSLRGDPCTHRARRPPAPQVVLRRGDVSFNVAKKRYLQKLTTVRSYTKSRNSICSPGTCRQVGLRQSWTREAIGRRDGVSPGGGGVPAEPGDRS